MQNNGAAGCIIAGGVKMGLGARMRWEDAGLNLNSVAAPQGWMQTSKLGT